MVLIPPRVLKWYQRVAVPSYVCSISMEYRSTTQSGGLGLTAGTLLSGAS